MPMPRLKSCCCGCKLKTGTILIISYSLIWFLILFGFELYFQLKYYGISALSIFIYIIVICSHIFGIIGVVTKLYLLLLPFVILQWAYLVLIIVSGILFTIFKDGFYYEVVGFVLLLLMKSTHPEIETRRGALDYVRKIPSQNPTSLDFEKQKKTISIVVGVLAAISFVLNFYMAFVVLSCLLEMREQELWVPKKKTNDWDYD